MCQPLHLQNSLIPSFAQVKLHERELGYSIVSFTSHEDREAVRLVSRAWSTATRAFPKNLVKKLQDKVIQILPNKYIVKKNLFKIEVERTEEIEPHFVEMVTQSLTEIAKTSTGEKLL